MAKYKMIACDLDETLIGTDHTSSQRDIEAIRRVKEEGIKFVPATGRPFTSVTGTLKQLGLYEENQYVISFNGGAVTENRTNKVLYCEGISFELASELYKQGLQYDVCIHVYTGDKTYAYHLVPEEIEYQSGRQVLIETFETDPEFLRGQEIIKVLYMNTDYEYLFRIKDDLSTLTENLDISYSSNRYMEFNPKGVNKGSGLKVLADLLNIPIEDIIAIGDNLNDLPMIKMAGLGVGVKNLVASMKDDCDYICEKSCDESAVAEVIHKFILDCP